MSMFSPSDLLGGLVIIRQSSLAQILVAGDFFPTGQSEKILVQGQDSIWGDVINQTSVHHLNIVNLESPLTHAQTKIRKAGPHLSADPLCARGIRKGGFDVVTLANNHILDMGEPGLLDTIATCEEAGLKTVGAGRTLDDASRPLYIEVNNVRIAVIAIAEHEFSIATPYSAGAWPLDLIDNYHQIQDAKHKSDFVLLILHGGNEYYPLPSPRLLKTCRFLADSGANAVICHHTHVPSGLEIYNGVPIVYGTGNLLFHYGKPTSPEWFNGYLVSLGIMHNAVSEIRLIPFWQYFTREGLQLMDDASAHHFLEGVIELSSIITDKTKLSSEWDKFCRSKHNAYLSRMLSLTKLEHYLLRRGGITPFWRRKRDRITTLLSLIHCESHRDVTVAALTEALRGFDNHKD